MFSLRKKEIIHIMDLLAEAGQTICELAQNAPEEAVDVLTQSQQLAIYIGNQLEAVQGADYTGIIHKLEAFCELVYQISVQLQSATMRTEAFAPLQDSIRELREELQRELPEDRREVVFLPYKASMWDSLESAWKKECQREDADVYVIPIPYYDKNPDGSFRQEHYEGNQYPAYVPVVDYQTYDMEARQPDAIYIHNPYDASNHVTSVAPAYYSRYLKQYTKELIYIPYFVLREPESREDAESIRHFCVNPGVLHAHKVIVQSKAMRQVYIDSMTQEMGEQTRTYWEHKIVAGESPKLDKIRRTGKEDVTIPEEWRLRIRRQDGRERKVILYNTGVTAMLEQGEKMLRKIENVFAFFRQNTEQVVLLWRPHPLLESTLHSMLPELEQRYIQIRKRYIEEGWGIYDDTPELDRAIVVSDAYYGDSSSVVCLYQEIGKPVMIQNVEVECKENV